MMGNLRVIKLANLIAVKPGKTLTKNHQKARLEQK